MTSTTSSSTTGETLRVRYRAGSLEDWLTGSGPDRASRWELPGSGGGEPSNLQPVAPVAPLPTTLPGASVAGSFTAAVLAGPSSPSSGPAAGASTGASPASSPVTSLQEALEQVPSSHDLLQNTQQGPCRCPLCSQMEVIDQQAAQITDQKLAAALSVSQALPATRSGSLAASTLSSLNLADTFLLHSNPGATKRIFLDFDGYESASSIWENGGALKLNPFYTSFTDSVKLEIQRIWQRVSEDYAPFNVDVTTQDPGTERLRNSGGSDTEWGIRMVFTDNYNLATGAAIINAGGGGTAYYNSFNWSTDEPALGFNRGEYAASETASHEIGHSLNLKHDGTSSSAYYGGHGSGETSWGGLMGAPFIGNFENVTTWSKGDYYNANNLEDDLSIITTSNGFGYRTDDHGNSLASATALKGSSFSRFGTVERNTDLDWFRFDTGSGAVSLTLTNANQAWVASGSGDYNSQTYTSSLLATRGPNLDIEARLYKADGTLVAISNPVDQLTASFDLSLAAGTYYLSVDGVGVGTPFSSTPTGYTDYASLGQYLLTGTVVEPVNLVVTASGDPVTTEAGGSVSFAVQLSKQPTSTVTVLVSTSKPGEGLAHVSQLSFDINNWNTAQTIVVTGQDDSLVDGTVAYNLVLDSSGSAAAEYAALPATLVALTNLDNDQPLVSLSSTTPGGSLRGLEGVDGSLSFTVSLDRASLSSVSVNLATANGTALAGSDFTALNQTLLFNPGETQKTIQVALINDNVSEADEQFDLVLSGPQNAVLGSPTRLTATISDTLASDTTTTLTTAVENLLLTGTQAIDGTGNSSANRITGNSAVNRLKGGGGLDVLSGQGDLDVFDLSGISSASHATTVTDFVTGLNGELLLLSDSLTSRSGGGMASVRTISSLSASRLTLETGSGIASGTSANTGFDVFLFNTAITEADVDLAASSNGAQLLDGLNNASGSVRLSTSTGGGKGYIGAYDNNRLYLFAFNAGSDSGVAANEIQRIGILEAPTGISAGSLVANNLQLI